MQLDLRQKHIHYMRRARYNAPMKKQSLMQLALQFLRFSIVGILAFFIDYGLFLLMTYVFGVWYIAASTISFLISTVFNYIMSMRYVFQGKETQTAMQQFVIFCTLSIIGLGLNQLFLWILTGLLSIAAWIGKLGATALVAIYNFITRKIFLEDHSKQTQ